MNESFTSVLLFHTALKNFLTTTLGWSVDRVLGANDVILSNGTGAFLRLQKKTNGSVVSVSLELGADPDALELSTKDPELCFPFDTAEGGLFQGIATWLPEASRLDLAVTASGERWSKRYRLGLAFNPLSSSLVHQDHLNPETEPNFKERGGTYIQAGV